MKTLIKKVQNRFKILLLLVCISFSSNETVAQVFHDRLENDAIGEWPKNWDVVNGSVKVNTIDGKKVIDLENNAIIKPVVNNQTDNYLSDTFTLEFDAFFERDIYMEHMEYQIRLWDGFGYHVGDTRMSYIKIRRNGAYVMIANPNEQRIENFPISMILKTFMIQKVRCMVKPGRILNSPMIKAT